MEKTPSLSRRWFTIVLPFACGFLFTSIFRSINAVLATHLEAFGLSETEAGFVSSVYFIAFALFQIPLGVWLDRYHIKHVQASLFSFAAIGVIGFGFSDTFWFLSLFRVITAMGLCGGLMAAFKIVGEWFTPHQVPFVNGMIVTFGSFGTIISATPVALYLQYFSFLSLFLWLSLFLFLLAAVIFFLCPLDPGPKIDIPFLKQCKEYPHIYSNKQFLTIAPLVALCFSVFTMFRSYWMNPFMRFVNHLPQTEIVSIILYSSIAFIIGSSIQGMAGSSFTKRERGVVPLIYCNCALFITLSICILFTWIPPIVAWPLITFTPAWLLLVYSVIPTFFTNEYRGRAISGFNFILFTLIFIDSTIFGYLIDLFHLRVSIAHAYQMAWGCLILLQLLAFLWVRYSKRILRA